MTRLRIYDDTKFLTPEVDTVDETEIAERLRDIGVRFERWRTRPIVDGVVQDAVLAAHRSDVDRLMREGGYASADVVRVDPDHPQREALRNKFLNEHVHSEDEVRFFVEGAGNFYLHVGDKVYSTLCEHGDLLGVPANMLHWFDMGELPRFTCIRLFTNPEGWVAQFSGNPIAERCPKFGE